MAFDGEGMDEPIGDGGVCGGGGGWGRGGGGVGVCPHFFFVGGCGGERPPPRGGGGCCGAPGDGSGKRLVAPLHRDDDEISADARGGKRLGKLGSGGDRGFGVLNQGNRRRRSDPLRCGGGKV